MMANAPALYKVLVDGKSCHGGELRWSLPKRRGRAWIPGGWHKMQGLLSMCGRGLHLTTKPERWWKPGCAFYAAEGRGKIQEDASKILFRSARLLSLAKKPARLEKTEGLILDIPQTPFFRPDRKPLKHWKLFEGNSWYAAWDAAWDAARNSAWDAARNSAWDAAWDAARNSAGDAARNSARDAARDAAWDAYRNSAWDAAWDASRNAARNAARNSAWDAAWDASRNSAWNSAWNAAWDASRNSAWNSAWDASRNSARDSARDAYLYVVTEGICSGIKLPRKHLSHARARWQVWQKGYALLCDVNGVLYVYAKREREEEQTA